MTLKQENLFGKVIHIGKETENNFRTIDFDVTAWRTLYPAATISIVYQPPTGTAYSPTVSLSGNTLTWSPTRTDTAYEGTGTGQLILVNLAGDVVGRSDKFSVIVDDGIASGSTPPDTAPSWVEDLLTGIDTVGQAATDAALQVVTTHNVSETAHGDIKEAVQTIVESISNVDNTHDADKPISVAAQTALDGKSSILHDHDSEYAPIGHISNTDNPHSVTKAQVGLGNADNTRDIDKPLSDATVTALAGKQDSITVSGILKGDGLGGLSAAAEGTDYATPEQVALKQDALTFDDAPTAGSDNPVKSGGIYEYIFAKQYGVRFSGGANTGANAIRLYNAAGLIANVGTDTVTAINDFDSIYPWSARKRCCGMFNASGDFAVNAYKGEPGYTEDGSNGEVWIEHSLFYYKHTYTGDVEEIVVSDKKLADMLPAPVFINPDGSIQQKAYTAAYPMATVDGVATSRSGVFSDVNSLNSAMVTARSLGTNYTTQTTAEWYTECLYMWIEFATRNLQSIMNSASGMPYDATHATVVNESGVNRIIIANAKATAYVVGQTILIGTSLGNSNIANNRIVTAINTYDVDNKAIVFDGAAVNITAGNVVCTAAYKNGSCDGVLSSSGSPISNTDGKHNCIYRGKETPYGNAYESLSDVLFQRAGAGTAENPYTYDVYYLPNPTTYNDGSITADYIKLDYKVPVTDGYAKKLGVDSRYPHLRIPSEIGAGSTTYYSDYYYYPRDAISAARVGGRWSFGPFGGPCSWNCNDTPSDSNVIYRARLSYHRT